jgi:hypothetical protein
MKHKTLSLVLATLFAATTGVAVAVDPPGGAPGGTPGGAPGGDMPGAMPGGPGGANGAGGGAFEKLDKNKDGIVSKDEAKGDSGVKKNFSKWDTNKDGKLSKAEYEAGQAGGTPPG